MLPPLDSTWTWDAWAAAQVKSDPWKLPHTRSEVMLCVHRGAVIDIRPWEMEEMLQVPLREIKSMLSEATQPDPFREEMRALYSRLRVEAKWAKMTGALFPGVHAASLDRLTHLRSLTHAQLEGITEVADPEIVAAMLRDQDLRLSDERMVERYFDLLRQAREGTLLFPPPDPDGRLGARQTRVGFQAVSAILSDLGLSWLQSYSPRAEGRRPALEEFVHGHLAADPAFAATLEAAPELAPSDLPSVEKTFAPAPPRASERLRSPALGNRTSKGWDRSTADAVNKELGKGGEEFVLEVERRRLGLEGRADLAARVIWTAQDVGDGAGYDVHSFNADGSSRLIEVKTTNGAADTQFFLTANEIRVSTTRSTEYWLYRVYEFNRKSRAIWVLPGALDAGELRLEPMAYRATR